jgi:pentafunctional AROM polypeptide
MDKIQSEFFLFGSPIQHSLSPLLHNTGFRFHNLDKTYSLCDTTEIDQVVSVLHKSTTAGGSVTIPHKQAIMPHVDFLSDAARSIDAVNTIWKVIFFVLTVLKNPKEF